MDAEPPTPGKPRRYPWRLALKMMSVLLRIRRQKKLAGRGAEPPSGFSMKPIDDGYNQGVPIGGIGAGSIGRSYRGDFARWHLLIGEHVYHPSLPNQFHVRIESDGRVFCQTLNPRQDPPGRLSTWAWGLDGSRATYYALFPRAWTVYDFHDYGIELVMEQISPVMAHNYKESSYPVGVFNWKARNVSNRSTRVSVMLTWENAVSPLREPRPRDSMRGQVSDERILVELEHERNDAEVPVSFGLGVEAEEGQLSIFEQFNTGGDGSEIWLPFSQKAGLDAPFTKAPKRIVRSGTALCATLDLLPSEEKEATFAIAWDIPLMQFGQGRRWYRRYTKFFGRSGNNSLKIASAALSEWRLWRQQIEEWQRPVLESDWPSWLKSALFNELYYVVDGGTAWEAGRPDEESDSCQAGHFAYLECFDYPFYNTYDVHFYASFALLENWPDIELSIQRDFADAVKLHDPRVRMLLFEGEKAPRKPFGIVPHDLGMPREDPWIVPNSYNAQDVSRWKDLNTKFVLQVYRDFAVTGDREFLAYCWDSVKIAMEYADRFDRDGDGLVENDGFPDQTYDVWTMKGPSAYCAGLYLAASAAMVAMAREMNDRVIEQKYEEIFSRGRLAFEEKLWNGEYFNFDSSGGKHSDSIMADMLAGLLYVHASGLESYVDHDKARAALKKIFATNVMSFEQGNMGAVNGMRPNGKIDTTSIQSAEVWTGTSYALAALMAYEGMIDEAFKTAHGIYRVTYETHGYWFRTPEAWTKDGHFRASMYMRPLAVWAIRKALTERETAPR